MYSEEQPRVVEEKRRGSVIVGSTKDIEFLDEEIPTNITCGFLENLKTHKF